MVVHLRAKRSTVITIHCRAKSPELAQIVAKAVSESYLIEHLRLRESSGSLEFFLDRTQRLREELEAQDELVRKYKQEHKVLSVASNQALLEARRNVLMGELQSANAELKKVLARRESIQENLEEYSHHSVRTKLEEELINEDINRQGIEAQIAKLEAQHDELQLEQLQFGQDEEELVDLQRNLAIVESNYLNVRTSWKKPASIRSWTRPSSPMFPSSSLPLLAKNRSRRKSR